MRNKILKLCLIMSIGGFLNADETYDSNQIADIFYSLNGKALTSKEKKINHLHGFCAAGTFEPSKEIMQDIDLPFLGQNHIPTQVRYSLGGAIKSDKSKPRGLALHMMGNNETWTMVMLNSEINFAKNPKEFAEFFQMKIPVNGKVDTQKIKKLTQEVDSYRNFEAYMEKVGISSSVSNTAYYSIHTFMFKDKKSGEMIPARWKFVPLNGIKYLSKEELKQLGDKFLAQKFQKEVAKKPVEYQMYLVLANKGDIIDDTTALWKGEHKELLVGTLKVEKYEGEGCNNDVYFPSELPSGVGEPKDPLFKVRNETYGVTFGRRQ
ncbi:MULTISPECIES: catalase [unclassified Helicobacter]|uniref:catalase n=1 Tax=unclassified Helicobacter TaxID=2593540 RepID=UPI000CF0C6BE|nr:MULTISPECIES: catalase [unclassified Helicobacter]